MRAFRGRAGAGVARRILLAALVPLLTLSQDKPGKGGTQWIEITLEQIENGAARTIDPGLVLNPGDLIRFRVRNNFDGYLYVINYGTSGVRSLLFPREETGRRNRVAAGTEYSVPSTGASFRVAGPAGHDLVYWLISPVALTGDPLASLADDRTAPAEPKLLPRCDESIFRARALCVDSSAGPRNVPGGEPLPEAISSIPRMTRRELLIVREKESARVSVPNVLTGPVVYEFRVAHR
jgi:hypothetical protein